MVYYNNIQYPCPQNSWIVLFRKKPHLFLQFINKQVTFNVFFSILYVFYSSSLFRSFPLKFQFVSYKHRKTNLRLAFVRKKDLVVNNKNNSVFLSRDYRSDSCRFPPPPPPPLPAPCNVAVLLCLCAVRLIPVAINIVWGRSRWWWVSKNWQWQHHQSYSDWLQISKTRIYAVNAILVHGMS